MSVVLNPYSQHQAQLGVLENGLRSLKTSKILMNNNTFADMYGAIEKHHRDLRLAHLTGKAKDLMVQAEKDTKFYNILVKMLVELKKLPEKKQKDSLKKVHAWYSGNRHTLQSGPRFGKVTLKMESRDDEKGFMTNRSGDSRSQSRNKSSNSIHNKENKSGKKTSQQTKSANFKKFVNENRDEKVTDEERDNISTPHGMIDSVNPPSEPGSSRLSFGMDFMTSRFLSDLPNSGSKLSWTMDTPMGKSPFADMMTPTTEWEGTDMELQRIAEGSFSAADFPSRLSAHFSHDLDSIIGGEDHEDRGSVLSDNSGGVGSSPEGFGSEMMDLSEVRRRLSRPQTSSGSLRNGETENASSSDDYGRQRRMVHSIASLVNPHAKLAETEARRAEEEYQQQQLDGFARTRMSQSARKTAGSSRTAGSSKTDQSTINEQTVVLRPVTVTGDNVHTWKAFSKDHVYGQDILNSSPLKMPRIVPGKLTFVGRSGTALDVRYSAHDQGEMPERHTKHVISLFKQYSDNTEQPKENKVSESNLHSQSLEDFYQTTDKIFAPQLPKYPSHTRTQSAQVPPRAKSAKKAKTASTSTSDKKASHVRLQHGQQTAKDTAALNRMVTGMNGTGGVRPENSDIKLDTVVNMIDMVKDEMNFFREKLAPTPMPGFKHPSSSGVPNKPLSRPTTGRSRRSPSPVRRSPSPVQRANTPTQEPADLLMGEPAVPLDTMKSKPLLARPHSATVSQAVDWRGKISPDAAKNNKWSKTRFGGHTYIQRSKPSLRTAGRVTGKRPKTAPVSTRNRWHTEKESDHNIRVAQAASNTVREVDQKEVDKLMTVSHILGTSDSRFGSYGSLFLDEDFLRSINSRYTPTSSMGGPQTKEYLSIVGTLPKTPSQESHLQSLQGSVRRPEPFISDRIPEEGGSSKDEETADVTDQDLQQNGQEEQEDQPYGRLHLPLEDTVLGASTEDISSVTLGRRPESGSAVVPPLQLDQDNLPSSNTEEADNTDRVLIHGEENEEPGTGEDQQEDLTQTGQTQDKEQLSPPDQRHITVQREDQEDDVHIEVTSVPALGRPLTPQVYNEKALLELSKSETWQYEPDVEDQPINSQEYIRSVRREELRSARSEGHIYHLDQTTTGSVVKPESYCFDCMSDNMTTKVGRSAGRMPGRSQSPAGQVLRMARRQNESIKKAPPVRTAPSIPSPHHTLTARSPRTGQAYRPELEHHARKIKSPRHFMEHVVELRNDNCRSAPPSVRQEQEDMSMSLNVISLRVPNRAHTAPSKAGPQTQSDSFAVLSPFPEEEAEEEPETKGVKKVSIKQTMSPPCTATSQSIAHIGRPIAQVSKVPDPDIVAELVQKQREAKAAVDIQRIFRGFVARNVYNKLLWEERQVAEDKQMEQVENQKQFRKHLGRKAKIYSRPPINPESLKWAKEFKEVQTDNKDKRQGKMDSLQREMSSNQLKASSKISTIGPHVEIYDIYHPKQTGPSRREMHDAAILIQKQVKGFLVRRRFEKLKRKAVFCGSTWKKMVREYKNQLIRVQRWRGVEKPSTPFTLQEMYDYMDNRRRYESLFDKKSFSGELELIEVDSFFRECDLFPSAAEIEDGIDVILQGHTLKKGQGLLKNQVLNLMYYIYVPTATKLQNTRQSTWMNPIIDGVEAKKLLGSEFVEAAPLNKCADLVINSRRERREKEQKVRDEELRRLAAAEDDDEEEEEEANIKKSRRGSRKPSVLKKTTTRSSQR